jgi:O-antigen ligase
MWQPVAIAIPMQMARLIAVMNRRTRLTRTALLVTLPRCFMFSLWLLYVGVLFVRPGEIWARLEGFPFFYCTGAVAATAMIMERVRHERKIFELPADVSIVAFLVTAIVSQAFYLAGMAVAFTEVSKLAFTVILTRFTLSNYPSIRRGVIAIVSLVAFLAVDGIAQALTGIGFTGITPLVDDQGNVRIRGSGIFNDPNDLGLTLLFATGFCLEFGLGKGAKGPVRALALLALGVFGYAVYLTNSRGAILGLAVAAVAFAYLRGGRRWGIVLAILGIAAITAIGPSRIENMEAGEESAQGRIHAWSAGLQMLKAHPVFGAGYGTYLDWHDHVAHNSGVHVLGELGLVGALAWFSFLYFAIRPLIDYLRTSPTDATLGSATDQSMARGLAISLCGFASAAFFLSRQYTHVFYLPPAFAAALASAWRREGGRVHLSVTRTDVRWIAAITGGFVCLVWLIVRVFAIWGAGAPHARAAIGLTKFA